MGRCQFSSCGVIEKGMLTFVHHGVCFIETFFAAGLRFVPGWEHRGYPLHRFWMIQHKGCVCTEYPVVFLSGGGEIGGAQCI